MYECLICNYSTNNEENLYHHNKLETELKNKDDEIEKLKEKLADSENQKKEIEIKFIYILFYSSIIICAILW